MLHLSPRFWLVLWTVVGLLLAWERAAIAQSISAGNAPGTIVTPQGQQFFIHGGTQAGENLFHQFQQFGLSRNQTATFQANPSIGRIFSRVTGGQASVINGLLQVQGGPADLFFINPAGIIFGRDARLDLPGNFTATTANSLQFANGPWGIDSKTVYGNLTGHPTGYAWLNNRPQTVINTGNLQVQSGWSVMLSGGSVINTGSISAPGGQVTIAAVPGEGFLRVNQTNQILSLDLPIAAHSDPPTATTLQPNQLPQLLTGNDAAAATGITIVDGQIRLSNDRPPIQPQSGQAIVSGDLTAAQIDVTGERIDLQAANLNVSQVGGGGKIRVGGDFRGQGDLPKAKQVNIDAASELHADAIDRGNGGEVIIWSDDATQFLGQATAQGGAQGGDGGLVETSSQGWVNLDGAQVKANALFGKPGEWLVDPSNFRIVSVGAVAGPGETLITANAIATTLDGGTNVTLNTALGAGGQGDIALETSINQLGGGNAALTLTGRRFNRVGDAQINLTSTGGLTFNLNQVNPEVAPNTSNIQNAIDAIGTVAGNRTINLGTGFYQGTPGFALVTVDKNVTIDGGDQLTTALSGNNNSRVFFIPAATTATLRNLSITNGRTTATESGAGILNEGNLTLENVTVQDSVAGLDGGGIDSSAPTSSLLIFGASVFLNNQAGSDGGGLFVGQNTQFLQGAVLNNQAGNDGGGIYNIGNLTLRDLRISNNSAVRGGGIASLGTGSTLSIQNFLINQNSATQNGGGVFSNNGITLTSGSLENNQSSNDGGAIANTGAANIQNVRFQSNQAVRFGGGILQINGPLGLTNTVFDANQASTGGAMSLNGPASINAINADFLNNQASDFAGAINTNLGNGSIQIADSSFRGNQAGLAGGALYNETLTNIDNTLFDSNTAGTDGGAIVNERAVANLTITNSDLNNNSAVQAGRAILNISQGRVNLNDARFDSNRANRGGAISSQNNPNDLTIDNSLFSNNQANDEGGAIVTESITDITNTTFNDNQANNDGGAILSFGSGRLTIDQSIFLRNQAIDQGGAIGLFDQAQLAITNSLLTSNQATSDGGAIANNSNNANSLSLSNSRFDRNTSQEEGGAIYLGAQNQGTIRLSNTTRVIASNRAWWMG